MNLKVGAGYTSQSALCKFTRSRSPCINYCYSVHNYYQELIDRCDALEMHKLLPWRHLYSQLSFCLQSVTTTPTTNALRSPIKINTETTARTKNSGHERTAPSPVDGVVGGVKNLFIFLLIIS